MPKPRVQNGRSGNSPNENPTCAKCGKGHIGEYFGWNRKFPWLWQEWSKSESLPNMKAQEMGGQDQASGSFNTLMTNRFHDLHNRDEQETSLKVVIAMLKFITIDVYDLLDPRATLSVVTPLVTKMLDTLPDILHEPFLVCTLVDDSDVKNMIYKNCPIIFRNRVSNMDLLELDMLDFNIILGME